MADKKWVAVSYCCIFISIYFLFISYAALSAYTKTEYNYNLPSTVALNATTSAISSYSPYSGIGLLVCIVTILLFIIFSIFGQRAMNAAI